MRNKDDQINFLWGLLDDISTAGDVYKPEITPYFKSISRISDKRSEVAQSFDGHTLTINELPSEDLPLNVKNINSAAEIRASDAAVIKFIDNLIQCARDVINEKGDISVTYSELIKNFTEIKDNRISKGE